MQKPALQDRLSLRAAPARPFVMRQRWQELLFLHWVAEPAEIQQTLPPGLHVDTFEGRAWVAIVPFLMRGIRPRWCPPVPGISSFLEMNLRTYVHDDSGRAGVWFYSLECNQPSAVWAARRFFHLNYQRARMSARHSADRTMLYTSQRAEDARISEFIFRLEETACHEAEPGSLEFFLAERYLLFTSTPGGLRTGRVHHAPYPLCTATLEHWDTRLFALNGIAEPGRPPDHVMGSPGVDVRVWPLAA